MDLIFFDLDGTLLNKSSKLTAFTKETLGLLSENNIAHTVATGRTMHSARRVVDYHQFDLPHIYSNGVTIWDPRNNALALRNLLNFSEVEIVIESAFSHGLTPFVNTMKTEQDSHQQIVFHSQPRHQVEKDLITNFLSKTEALIEPLASLSSSHFVTNVGMVGATDTVNQLNRQLEQFESLVAYSGAANEGGQFSWIDVHHRQANKGNAVENLRAELGASNVICFGDSYNDISMFELANESYAPQNAKDEVKKIASGIIGHHHDDGVAHFLRERFNL